LNSSHAGIVVVRTVLWPCPKALKLASARLDRVRLRQRFCVRFVLRDDTRNVFDENRCYVVLPIMLA
jgi:hypothetical protein